MKKQITMLAMACLLTGAAQAQDTYFTAATNTDFAAVGNWDNGLPVSGVNGVINAGLTADLATSYLKGGAVLRVGADGSAGTLNLNSGALLKGSTSTTIGDGAGSIGTLNINSGGVWQSGGAYAHLFVGDTAGGQGFVTVASGGMLDARKRLVVRNGTLTYEPEAMTSTELNEINIDNAGVLAFQTDGAKVATIDGKRDTGGTTELIVGRNSTLDMQLAGVYSVGNTWTIFTSISSFAGTFGNVIDSTDSENIFAVHYGTGPAAAGEVVVELTSTSTGTVITEFNNGSADGSWANAANWSAGVPTASTFAKVNGGFTADMAGTSQAVKLLYVGDVANQAGAVMNGSLAVANGVSLGIAENASGTLAVTSITGGTVEKNMDIATAEGASGELTAVSGALTSAGLNVATGSNSVAKLEITNGSVTNSSSVDIATGQGSSAMVTLGNGIILNSTNDLFVGTGVGSSHNLTASDFSISGPLGSIGVGESTGISIKSLFSLNDTIGSLTVNSPLEITGGHHAITGISLTESLTIAGAASGTLSGPIEMAPGIGVSAILDISGLTGAITSTVVNIAHGDQSMGLLIYTNGNMHKVGTMEVGSGGNGSDATVLLKSLTGSSEMSVANPGGTATTGTVTILENADVDTLRVARGLSSVGAFTVGNTLSVNGPYLNAAALNSNAVGRISAATLNMTRGLSIQVAQASAGDGSIVASTGTLFANKLEVALGADSIGVFAVTNGVLNLKSDNLLQVASGDNSVGTVLVGITSTGTNDVSIGMGAGALGSLTLTSGSLTIGKLDLGPSSYIDVAGISTDIRWVGRSEAEFLALWNTGKLRRNGESGLTSAIFANHFQVSGDIISSFEMIPVGIIDIATVPDGVAISWDSYLGQIYDLRHCDNLLISDWQDYISIPGTGGGITVTAAVNEVSTFYQVITVIE